ncbi:MAG TPA: nucleoside triphosphate pyrophosphatase [Phycisphaerae bacterium]|nr:nucleoside triphosphate pyrophosphatase [Phycisphaerae bacterium]
MNGPIQPDPLVLASASPRRAQILSEAGYRFQVAAPSLREPEWVHPHVAPTLHAESLAYFKARSVAPDHMDKTVLAADTIAVIENEIIGKPIDRDDAYRILRRLSGTTHSVITGVVLLQPASGRRLLQHGISTVSVRTLSDQAIQAYLDTGAWEGKAGAYGIQDQDDPFVEKVAGSFTNVVGLPIELVARMFEHWVLETPPR